MSYSITKVFVNLSKGFFVFATIYFTSCKKFEEGPAFSLRSAKARITNDWVTVSPDYNFFPLEGDLTIDKEYFDMDSYASHFYGGLFGEWEFIHDNWFNLYQISERDSLMGDHINEEDHWFLKIKRGYISFDGEFYEESSNSFPTYFEIVKLTNKELWLRDAYITHKFAKK